MCLFHVHIYLEVTKWEGQKDCKCSISLPFPNCSSSVPNFQDSNFRLTSFLKWPSPTFLIGPHEHLQLFCSESCHTLMATQMTKASVCQIFSLFCAQISLQFLVTYLIYQSTVVLWRYMVLLVFDLGSWAVFFSWFLLSWRESSRWMLYDTFTWKFEHLRTACSPPP